MKTRLAWNQRLGTTRHPFQILNDVLIGERRSIRFEQSLGDCGLFPLKPAGLEILQVNVGKMCNLTCTHCHVDAGPGRREIMDRDVMSFCLDALDRTPSIHTVDLTGGAPEMNPDFQWFVEEISKLNRQIMVRSNLTILVSNKRFREYPEFFAKQKLIVIASLPCYTAENTNKQRGDGVFQRSIEALGILNQLGYGHEDSGLELHLVYNPIGATMAAAQSKLQADYKKILYDEFGIVFNNLYAITNMPISRYLDFLLQSGEYEAYMDKLITAFNPAAAAGVMCRSAISVGWDGRLYDCDFNQMLELPVSPDFSRHINDFESEALNNRHIVVGQHCYGCTADSGSSCQGSLT